MLFEKLIVIEQSVQSFQDLTDRLSIHIILISSLLLSYRQDSSLIFELLSKTDRAIQYQKLYSLKGVQQGFGLDFVITHFVHYSLKGIQSIVSYHLTCH